MLIAIHIPPTFSPLLARTLDGCSPLAVREARAGEPLERGMRALRAAGGFTIAQDEESSVVYGMPKAAVESGAAMRIMPLGLIGSFLNLIVARRPGRQDRKALPAGRKDRQGAPDIALEKGPVMP